MIANPTIQGGGVVPTYETCTITFAGDFGDRSKNARIVYEDEYGEVQQASLSPYPDHIVVRKGVFLSVQGNYLTPPVSFRGEDGSTATAITTSSACCIAPYINGQLTIWFNDL